MALKEVKGLRKEKLLACFFTVTKSFDSTASEYPLILAEKGKIKQGYESDS